MKPDPVVLAACLQDQHALAGISREAVGDNATGGTGADDDIVEIPLETFRHSLSCIFSGQIERFSSYGPGQGSLYSMVPRKSRLRGCWVLRGLMLVFAVLSL